MHTTDTTRPTRRNRLPQLEGPTFLTDAGLETVLIFHEGLDLPAFAAFPLVDDPDGRAVLIRYYEEFLATAAAAGTGFVLEAPTWRANADWAGDLGYDADALRSVNRRAIELMEELRARHRGTEPVVISGCIGPRGDGYAPTEVMSSAEAADYHRLQLEVFATSAADLATAMTITYVDEAVGIASAPAQLDLPVVISFTVETDGRLVSGPTLAEAIAATDEATGAYPAYYMVNCAHPSHFDAELEPGAPWMARIGGLRANASTLSHAELDEAEVLDDGDPVDLAARYRALVDAFDGLAVVGGCCGTDHRHVAAMASALSR